MSSKALVWWTVLGGCAVLMGCNPGPPMGTVTGTVKVDGTPASGLQVQFEPQDEISSSSLGFTRADGTYQLQCTNGKPGAIAGKHVVRVTASESREGQAPVAPIPAKYNTKSTEIREVKPGPNSVDIEILTR